MFLLEYPEERPKGKPLPPMDFTERDGRILCDIHAFEGLMSLSQIQLRHFSSQYQTRIRVNKLWHHDWVKKANRKWRMTLPDQVFWLSPKGAEFVASTQGKTLEEFSWRKKPRGNMIYHDLKINDFRLSVIKACELDPRITLEESWVTSREFWAYPDTIEVEGEDGKPVKRQVRPDGYFSLIVPHLSIPEKQQRRRYIVEIDLQSEANTKFQRAHGRHNLAYLQSGPYERRFGKRGGLVLVVTVSQKRMMNMKAQTELSVGTGARFFMFTEFDAIAASSSALLSEPIWFRGGEDRPTALLTVT